MNLIVFFYLICLLTFLSVVLREALSDRIMKIFQYLFLCLLIVVQPFFHKIQHDNSHTVTLNKKVNKTAPSAMMTPMNCQNTVKLSK